MDVTAALVVAASPERVALVMFDPVHDPDWIGGARSVEAGTGDPTAIGARATRHGGFMGKKFSWKTEVEGFEPARLLRMRFIEGPMKGGSVTYQIDSHDQGSYVSIRNTGPGPQIMSWFVRRSVAKDLNRLARLVEDKHGH